MADEKVRRLFLCRHGETEANEKGIYCGGKHDSPLTQEGKNQSALLGKALNNYYKFSGNFIFCSRRGRTIETANGISQFLEPKPNILTIEGLHEMDLGEWCGKTAEENQELFPREYAEWKSNILKPSFRFPGGESMAEARKRMVNCFNVIQKLWRDWGEKNDIIIVAHGGTNMIILAEILRVQMGTFAYKSIRQDNTCLNIINYCENSKWRPKIQIALVNSTHHLDMKF